MNSPLADFLTFISPICILILFFLCFFRFLFRSCSCCSGEGHPEESSCSTGPNSTSQNEHPGFEWMRSLIGAGGPQVHPVSAGHPFSATDVVFIPPHILEDPFPPKYEDALKMRAPTNEVATPRRQSITTINHVTPAASPPPIYEEESSPRETDHEIQPNNELPPNYSSPNLSASLSRHRNSLTTERSSPVFSAARRYRRSLGDAYLDIVPENEAQESPQSFLITHLASTSTQTSRPSSSDVPSSSSPTDSKKVQEAPRRVSIDMSITEYEVPLPGAIENSEETTSNSPPLDARRNSNRRVSCITVSDLNVQTI